MVKYIKASDTPKGWPKPARVSGWYVVAGTVIVGEPCATKEHAERIQREFYASEHLALVDACQPRRA
jgi:hypothetical protein